MEDILEYAEANKSEAKVLAEVASSRKLLDLNYKLMQLDEVDIHGTAKESIRNIVDRPMQRLEKTDFLKYTVEDQITIVKNPEFWLRDSFNHLDTMSALEQ